VGFIFGTVKYKGRVLSAVRVDVVIIDTDTLVSRVHSDSRGYYYITIASGDYTVRFYGRGIDSSIWYDITVPGTGTGGDDTAARLAISALTDGGTGWPPTSVGAGRTLLDITNASTGKIETDKVAELSILDDAVTPVKLATPSLGVNIVPAKYSNFESAGLNGFIASAFQTSACTVSVDTSNVLEGGNRLKITPDGLGPPTWAVEFRAVGGFPFLLIKTASGIRRYIFSLFMQAETGTPSIDVATFALTDYWDRYSLNFDLPAGNSACYLELSGLAASGDIYVEGIMLEPSNIATKEYPTGYKVSGDFSHLEVAKALRWDDTLGLVDFAGNTYPSIGGGSVPDAANYRGTLTSTAVTEQEVCSVASGSSPAGWKLRGFIVNGENDALVKIYDEGTELIRGYLHRAEQTLKIELPNPEAIDTGHDVSLTVTPKDITSSVFFGVILGEI
jgi:hypothetical protein